MANGVPVRHIQNKLNCPMYISNIDCLPSGPFCGKMVVSMGDTGEPCGGAIVTSRYCFTWAPIWIGDLTVRY